MVEHASQQPLTNILSGLRKLRTGALLQAVATMLGEVPVLFLFAYSVTGTLPCDFFVAMGLAIGSLFIAMILAIIGVYVYLLSSAEQFAPREPERFLTSSKLMRIGYLAGAPLIIVAALGMIAYPPVFLVLVAAGLILFFIGLVGIAMYFLGLRDIFNSTPFLITAILMITASVFMPILACAFELLAIFIIMPIFGFAAWIDAFIEAGSLEKRIALEHKVKEF